LLLVPCIAIAGDPWWKTAFPGSFESKEFTDSAITTDRPYYDNEHPAVKETNGPEVYHWDNIYLEKVGPEVIIDPYAEEKV